MTPVNAVIESEQTTLALEDLRPAEDNPRRNLGDLSTLTASIRTVGLLEPIVVTHNGQGYTIVAGARRHAAAKKAGMDTVPVVVLANLTEEQRQEAMLIENLQRSDLAPLEEASAFRRLVDLGLTQRDLATKIGCSASHISKRLQLLELPAAAQDAVDAGTLPIADALDLKKLAGKPQAVVDETVRLVTEPDRWGHTTSPSRALEEATRKHEQDKRIAAATKLAQADPAPFVEPYKDGDSYYITVPMGAMALGKGYRCLPITPAKHRKQPCHAVTVTSDYRSAQLTYICTKPKSHPEFKKADGPVAGGRGALTDKEKAKRRAKREHNAALAEATIARHEFVHRLFAKKMTAAMKDDAIALLISEYFGRDPGVSFYSRGIFADSLLGVKPKKRSYGQVDAVGAIQDHLKANTHETLRVALAIGVGTAEDNITGRYPAWTAAKAYYEFLERHGYEPSKAESLALQGKAPR